MMTTSTATTDIIRAPFTATQWQELEHQALIFKYMVSGVQIPPELIFSVKRSQDSTLFPHQPIGWGCFQVGYGRKADPEPGRCRRTDGKKWRCSKEAYPDSKYCERHMHRGKNRSRKPVEISSSSPSPSPSSSSSSSSSSTLISSTSPISMNTKSADLNNPFLYPPKSTCISSGFSSPHMFLDPGSCTSDKDYRYFHGIKEGGVDERDFFPLMTNSIKGYSHDQSQFHHQSFSDNSKPQQQEEEEQHCFVLGRDFKSSSPSSSSAATRPLKITKEDHHDEDEDTQKPLHHFFGQWPPKNTDSWLVSPPIPDSITDTS